MNQYAIKFERENKPDPSNWVIVPSGGGSYRLVHCGQKANTERQDQRGHSVKKV